jgi:hypothetical protein
MLFMFLMSEFPPQNSPTISLSTEYLWLRYRRYDRLAPKTIVV